MLEERIKAGVPSICFGSRNLFRKQFTIKDNGMRLMLTGSQIGRRSIFTVLLSWQEGRIVWNPDVPAFAQRVTASTPNAFAVSWGLTLRFPWCSRTDRRYSTTHCWLGRLLVIVCPERQGVVCSCDYGTGRSPNSPERKNGALGLDLNAITSQYPGSMHRGIQRKHGVL